MTINTTLPRLCDSNSTEVLRNATPEERDESIRASAEGHIRVISYRVAPSTCTDTDRFDRAGRGNWFATEDEAINGAISLDQTCPLEDDVWQVYRVEHVAYVEG